MVLSHQAVTVALLGVGLHELRIEFKTLLGVLESVNGGVELDESLASVGVDGFVLGVTSHTFVEFLNSSGEISLGE